MPEGEWKWLDQQKSHKAFIAIQAAGTTASGAVPAGWGANLSYMENMSVLESLGDQLAPIPKRNDRMKLENVV